MSVGFSFLLLAAVAVAFWKERPKTKESLRICGICVLMAVMGLIVSGGAPAFQAVQALMQAAAFACCVLRLRGERKDRRRRAEILRHCRRARRAPGNGVQPACGRCA